MHHHNYTKVPCRSLEEGLQAQGEAQGLVGAQGPRAQEGAAAASSSSSSSSFPSSLSSFSSYSLILDTTREVFAAGMLSSIKGPQRSFSLPTSVKASSSVKSDQGSSRHEEAGPSTLKTHPVVRFFNRDGIDDKVADLVRFLLLKYRTKELITKEEMLNDVIKEYKDHFSEIFREASECMKLVFGIDVKEEDPDGHSYVLVIAMGLTYDGMLYDCQSLPKTGLLINVLGVIFLEGNCAAEEVIWEVLGVMGVQAGQEHFIYGEPRKLITHDWVQEGYLVYRQVPFSDPVRYEFLWGPRALAETSKMKILEFVAKVNDTVPSAFPVWYEEALKDEEARRQAKVEVRPSWGAWPGVRSKATSKRFYPK
ncbi:melanoma-associated antigen 8-like [Nycticebus coucang]|uniref:melanoma-associated antigen 8-like n=1 Tax=Nycticebus coucang TaxID=9470 RepID=UPI00234D2A74|nr:melanoma-associated antigen 8-like [Nycticebus coucang]